MVLINSIVFCVIENYLTMKVFITGDGNRIDKKC